MQGFSGRPSFLRYVTSEDIAASTPTGKICLGRQAGRRSQRLGKVQGGDDKPLVEVEAVGIVAVET
jgi:hypothetical protein